MTIDEYNTLFKSQDGKCAVCKERPSKRLVIDHCHKTGKVRGLLCNSCNVVLGHSKDSIDRLKDLIKYIEEHNE